MSASELNLVSILGLIVGMTGAMGTVGKDETGVIIETDGIIGLIRGISTDGATVLS